MKVGGPNQWSMKVGLLLMKVGGLNQWSRIKIMINESSRTKPMIKNLNYDQWK